MKAGPGEEEEALPEVSVLDAARLLLVIFGFEFVHGLAHLDRLDIKV